MSARDPARQRDWFEDARTPEVELPERTVRRLYAPDGNVLVTVSDRPPVGFHQGGRSGTLDNGAGR